MDLDSMGNNYTLGTQVSSVCGQPLVLMHSSTPNSRFLCTVWSPGHQQKPRFNADSPIAYLRGSPSAACKLLASALCLNAATSLATCCAMACTSASGHAQEAYEVVYCVLSSPVSYEWGPVCDTAGLPWDTLHSWWLVDGPSTLCTLSVTCEAPLRPARL